MNWTEEAIAKMHRLAAEGLSATQIAGRMSTTKGVISGKMHRTGTTLTKKPGGVALDARKTITRKNDRTSPPLVFRALVIVDHGTGKRIPYTPRGATCQWPQGDPRSASFRMCGDGVSPGSSWCPHHHKLAHQKPAGSKSTSLGNFKGRLGLSGASK